MSNVRDGEWRSVEAVGMMIVCSTKMRHKREKYNNASKAPWWKGVRQIYTCLITIGVRANGFASRCNLHADWKARLRVDDEESRLAMSDNVSSTGRRF